VYLNSIFVRNIRNLVEQDIFLGPGFNYIYGANGAGKTALLEAVYLLARGRSFRSHRATPVICREHNELIVRVSVQGINQSTDQLGISKSRNGVTLLRHNGESVRRTSELAKFIPLHTLLPDAAELVYGAPMIRRTFVDWGLFHVKPSFVDLSRGYRRVLAQRNAYLKALGDERAYSDYQNDPWYEQYQNKALEISTVRDEYLRELGPYFEATLKSLAPELDVILGYDWGGLVSLSQATKKMSESWSRDVKLGSTQRGPHRGDLSFISKGEPACDEVSRGQAKLIASAVVLAQAKHLIETVDTKSIFLIDDFGAELDQAHWRKFLETLLDLGCQVIATSTEPLDESQEWVKLLADLQVFHVEHGRISAVSSTNESS